MPDEPILPIDDPRMKKPSDAVQVVDDQVRSLAAQMFEIMDREGGAGLAAIQIGIPKRVIVMDVPDLSGAKHRLALVNPEIVERSSEKQISFEGCLSMPGYDLPVERAAKVTARYIDLTGNRQELTGDGVLSVCLQHEIDHVNGVLFMDRVSLLRRSRAKSYFAKVRRRAA